MRKFCWAIWSARQVFQVRSSHAQRRRFRAQVQTVEQLESRTLLSGSPPTINPGQIFNLLSTKDVGSVVGTVQASDPEMEPLHFSIIDGNNGAFAISDATGQITVANKSLLNALASDTQLTIHVAESVAPVATVSRSVTVHLNRPPIAFNQTLTVPSAAATGQEIGSIAASDVEPNSALAYFITQGNESGVFVIDSAGKIKVTNGLLYGGLTFPKTLTVEVRDNGTPQGMTEISVTLTTNHAPVVTDQTLNVPAVVANGTVLGTIVVTDADAGQTQDFQFTLGNASNAFAVSPNGTVTVANLAAFEGLSFPHVLTLKVTDNGSPAMSDTALITINRNQAPVLADNQSFTVLSTDEAPHFLGTILATDPDSVANLVFSLESGGNGAFEVTSDGKLNVKNRSLVNGLGSQSTLIVKVTDKGTPALSDTAAIVVHVNHTPIAFDQVLSVPMNPSVNQVLGRVLADEIDFPQTLSFFITSGNEAGALAIDADGDITVLNKVLYDQSPPPVALTVLIRDNGDRPAETKINVTLTNNRPPTMANQTFDVLSTIENNHPVGAVVANDPDNGQLLKFELLNSFDDTFSLSSTGTLSVISNTLLTTLVPQVVLNVKVTDSGDPQLSTTSQITVRINHAPIFQTPSQVFTVPTDAQENDVVAQVVASDPDSGQSINYAITSGSNLAAWKIDPLTGQIKIANKASYDAVSFPVTLTIQAQDNGTLPAKASTSITLVGNHAPVLNDVVLTAPLFVVENTVIGKLVATDADANTLAFAIINGNSDGIFSIDADDGEIHVVKKALYDAMTFPVVLTVRVTDNGPPSLSDTAKITLARNSPPTIVKDQTFLVPLEPTPDEAFGTVLATNGDGSNTGLNYFIISGNEAGAFAINETTGVLTVKASANLKSVSYNVPLTIQVVEVGNPDGVVTENVTLKGNHAPTFIAQAFTAPDNPVEGTAIGGLQATDADLGQTLTYTIVEPTPAGLVIDSNTGVLSIGDLAEFQKATFPIQFNVDVTDTGEPTGRTRALVTIRPSETASTATISFDAQSFAIPAGQQAGTIIGTVYAYAKDLKSTTDVNESTRLLSFSLADGSASGFTIDPTTGVLVRTAAIAADAKSFTVQVTVRDLISPQISLTRPITVNVVTTNNHVPTAQNFTTSIDEHLPPGTSVGKIIADGADAGQKLSFSIAQTNVPRAFKINAATGEITVDDDTLLDLETNPVFYLRIKVSDDGKGVKTDTLGKFEKPKPLTTYVTAAIRLQPVKDAPVEFHLGTSTRTYRRASGPVRLDPEAVFRLKDPLLLPQEGTPPKTQPIVLQISDLTPGAKPKYRLQVSSEPVGVGRISVSRQSILYGQTVIGTFSGGKREALKITFNDSVTAAAIQGVLRRLSFESGGDASAHEIEVKFTTPPRLNPPDPSVTWSTSRTVQVVK